MAQGQYRRPEAVPPQQEPLPYRYKNFSPNQAALNRLLKKDGIITHDKAAFFDQGTMNSFCRREFLLRTKDGYVPSPKWYRAVEEYEHADIVKAHASPHLGKYVAMLHTVRELRRA